MEHEIKVKGSRYLVFNEDYYDSSGGMFDCELITDCFKEAEETAIELSKRKYYPDSASIFDIQSKNYYLYIDGKLDERELIKIK